MIIYLEEAVDRKRKQLGGALTLSALRDAVIEGALLRLRPKVMTVSTVVAGLLPIMWSTQVGAEVMKPLATPVLGGMVSSLVHVLIVTPVIFFWIRQRQLGLRESTERRAESKEPRRWWRVAGVGFVLIGAAGVGWAMWTNSGARSSATDSAADVVQIVRSGDIEIVLRAPAGVFQQGRNSFTVDFRSAQAGPLVDAGFVRASANMPMPGMLMSSGMQLQSSGTIGRYVGTADFGMAGEWQFAIEWDGPAGRGSTSFEGKVQ
jgi:Cu(I)/Ag(I) efflux system membrane protein CusA/SilA